METRKPAACAICYVQTGTGVAARKMVNRMYLCPTHAREAREGWPYTVMRLDWGGVRPAS